MRVGSTGPSRPKAYPRPRGTLLANFLFNSSAMESLSFLLNCHGGIRTVSTISTKTNILACEGGSGNRRISYASGPGAVGIPELPLFSPNR